MVNIYDILCKVAAKITNSEMFKIYTNLHKTQSTIMQYEPVQKSRDSNVKNMSTWIT